MDKDLRKFPLVRLAEKYMMMRNDSRVLSLRASIEVVRERIAQLAQRIDFEDAPDRMFKVGKLWAEYMEAKDLDKRVDMVILERDITLQFAKAREDYMAWEQMMQAMDLDRKLVDSEIKVVKEIRGILTAEDAYQLVAKMLAVITEVFPNEKEKLRQVQFRFSRLIGDHPDVVDETENEDDLIDA